MARRISDVQRVQQFFEDALLENAKLMLEIVTGIVRRRNGGSVAAPRKTRTDKGTKRQPELPLSAGQVANANG